MKVLLDELSGVEHDLMEMEVDLVMLIDDHIGSFESQVSELIKVLANAGKDFFQMLEETENTFKNDLMVGANSEMENVAQQPELVNPGLDEAKRVKLLTDREGMGGALGSFSDAHLLVIQTKDDQMQV